MKISWRLEKYAEDGSISERLSDKSEQAGNWGVGGRLEAISLHGKKALRRSFVLSGVGWAKTCCVPSECGRAVGNEKGHGNVEG